MNSCKNIRKCLYGSQVFKGNEQITKIYKDLFCEAGDNKISTCKRYQVLNMVGYCPSYVLPNSMSTIDNIIDKMDKEKKTAYVNA
jgi:hypothetical protein